MSEARVLTCIGCPLGCSVEVTLDGGEITSVTGNSCPRGEKYARSEVTNPVRIVTTSVRVFGSRDHAVTVSVKTAEAVPKSKIFDVLYALKGVSVRCPVQIGDVIVPDVSGTGVDIVATKNVY